MKSRALFVAFILSLCSFSAATAMAQLTSAEQRIETDDLEELDNV